MKKSEILNRYVSAIETGNWDLPKDSAFSDAKEVYALVSDGKTVQMFAEQAVVTFGSITGALLAFGGINKVSQGTRKALSKAIDIAINKTTAQ